MSTDRKKVLLVIPNLDFGGAQNAFARLSEIISPYCDLLLVVFNKNNLAPLTLYAPLVELKVEGAQFYTGKILAFAKRIRILRKIKRNFKPDLSISFLEGADYVNLLSSSGEQIFFYLHGSKYFDRNITGFLGFIRKHFLIPFFYSRADKILVVNERLSLELMEHFSVTGVPYQVMPNFYDEKELNTFANEPVHEFLQTMFDNQPTICISGRIAPEKGIDKFVTILPGILKRTPNLKVVVVGDGVFKETVIAICRKVNIRFADFNDSLRESSNFTVLFVGYQKNPYRFLKRSSIVVLPSLNEGMPNTIVEALCLGVPVIAADCPYGPRELLTKSNNRQHQWPDFSDFGILVPVLGQNAGEESAWTEAIVRMITDPSLRQHYAAMGRKRSQDFSKESSIQSWLKLLNEA